MRAAAAAASLLCLAAFGQGTVKVNGTVDASSVDGGVLHIAFNCTGSPTCTGSYVLSVRNVGCTNTFVIADQIVITGLDVSHPGPISGTATLRNGDFNDQRNPDGTCSIRPGTFTDLPLAYTGSWAGTQGTATVIAPDGTPINFVFTISVASPPPFDMTVSAAVDPVNANVTANIQFRPADVGKTGKVFVFAIAPSSLVKSAAAGKSGVGGPPVRDEHSDGPTTCTLAQLDANGQLVATSASNLQAYSSGVLSAQGQSVTLLNNVPTPQVSGATVYVGYGANANAMYTGGVNRSAVTIPGTVQCPSADSIAASFEGLWLKGDEAGWGINLTHQGTTLFATWFTYDADGSGMWLVMSNGAQTSPGNFSGALYRTVGPAFSANPFNSIAFPANYATVGTLSLSFTDANNGTMSYTVNGATQAKAITRFIYAAGGTNCLLGGVQGSSPNYQDLWLRDAAGTNEAGWGVNITHQGDILFATWFTYLAGSGSTNKGMWLVMSNGNKVSNGVYSGALQQTTGPAFSAVPFNASSVNRSTVGTGTFTFTDANNGTFNYTVNGVTQSKPIARFIYAAPSTTCQ
jgi:hypothetical protein